MILNDIHGSKGDPRIFSLYAGVNQELSSFSKSRILFDPAVYSRFKYGDGSAAKMYAQELTTLLEKELLKQKTYFLCGSAYQIVPTAAISLAQYLQQMLLERNYKIEYFKVHGQSFVQDYSSLSLAERDSMLSGISLYIDNDTKSRMQGKNVLVIDDIKITGLHRKALERTLHQAGAKNITFAYIAVLEGENIKQHPQIEWALNHHYVDSLSKLEEIAHTGYFLPNARTCKFILASPSDNIFKFAKNIPLSELINLIVIMRDDGYHRVKEYARPYKLLEFLCDQRVKSYRKNKTPTTADRLILSEFIR